MRSNENERILRHIMQHIRSGGSYARHIDNVRYPFDAKVLYRTRNGYIGWTCYGSSACRMNLRDLNWTIRNIFKMKPAKFLKTYIEMPIAC